MPSTDPILRAAAVPTIVRIRRDREEAPEKVGPLLKHIENNLFSPELDAKRLKQACGVRDNGLMTLFGAALDHTPYAYILDCRCEVARRLLAGTDLEIWRIAQLLGFSSLPVFSRAFERCTGERPSIYRDRVARKPGYTLCCVDLDTLRRAAERELDRGEADGLFRLLAFLYPESFGPRTDLQAGGAGGLGDASSPGSGRIAGPSSSKPRVLKVGCETTRPRGAYCLGESDDVLL